MRYVYHYSTIAKNKGGYEMRVDGIVRMKEKIFDMNSYRNTKRLIADFIAQDDTSFTIVSLSYHGTIDDGDTT